MATITLNQANERMNVACDYYDYEERTLASWRKSLENSEVHTYTFLSDNIALSNTGAIKKYHDNRVYTWMVR